MALQKKVRLESGDRFAFENIGDKIKGYYVATDQIETDYGLSKRHALKTKKGLVTFFGNAQINADLQDVPVGTYVEIELTGKKKVKRGMMKVFDFSFDLDDVDTTVAQDARALNNADANEEEAEEEVEAAATEDEEEEDTRPLPKSTVNSKPAQVDEARAQRAREMLRKRS